MRAVRQTGRDGQLHAQARLHPRPDGRQALPDRGGRRAVVEVAAVGLQRHAQPGKGQGGDGRHVIQRSRTARLQQQQINIVVVREDLQALARQAQLALGRLPGVADRAHEDTHCATTLRPGAGQLAVQQGGRILLDDDGVAPVLARLAAEAPVGQRLCVAVATAVGAAQATARRPAQGMREGPAPGAQEAAALRGEDAFGSAGGEAQEGLVVSCGTELLQLRAAEYSAALRYTAAATSSETGAFHGQPG